MNISKQLSNRYKMSLAIKADLENTIRKTYFNDSQNKLRTNTNNIMFREYIDSIKRH